MRRVVTFVFTSLIAVSIAAPAFADDKAIARGKAQFAAQKCSLCHSIEGKGNAKGSLDGVGSKLTAEQIRAWITNPKEMAVKMKATRTPAMKAFPNLSKEDVDGLVAYLETLKKK